MKKFLFYPLWKVDELERRLHCFELEGWRVSHITCSYFFDFVEAKPKDAEYVLLYDMPRDRTAGMYEYEHKLLSEHAANAIGSSFTGYDLFRITSENRRFDSLKKYRRKYFRYVLRQRVCISFGFFALSLCLLLVAILQQEPGIYFIPVCICVFFAFVLFTYTVYGYLKQVLNCKKQ